MSYIGSTPTTQSFISGTDYFNGDGSTTAFTLSRSVVSTNDIQATVNNVVQQPNTAYTVSGTTITFTSAPSAGTSNIYVRYLSTTTQSITPSQNTVSYSTLNSDTQSKLGISFKNRIINGACVISQRGTSFSLTTGVRSVTLDRWSAYVVTSGATATVTQSSSAPTGFVNSLLYTVGTGAALGATDFNSVYQKIEGYNVADMGFGTVNAKTFTLSFWAKASIAGTYGVTFRNDAGDRSYGATYSISSTNTWEYKTITIAGDQSGTWTTDNSCGLMITWGLGVGSTYSIAAGSWQSAGGWGVTGATNIVATSGATWAVSGVQLEVGTQATTFDYRSYGSELQLCQRYCQMYGNNGNRVVMMPFGIAASTSELDLYMTLPTPMRATPTVTTSLLSATDGNSYTNTTATPVMYQQNNAVLGMYIAGGWAAGLTQYRPYALITQTGGGYLIVTAEL